MIEKGPIRPPSEARSLLIRVTRNCTWNKCLFCRTYKGMHFSKRPISDVKRDIDTVVKIVDDIKLLSLKEGFGGLITDNFIRDVFSKSEYVGDVDYRSILAWLYYGGKFAFLQDANSMVLKTKDLLEIITYLKKRLPQIERITIYGRSRTISKKSVYELKELKDAGLSRIHCGIESGCDEVLSYMKKGASYKIHKEAGIKAKEAGISFCSYVILGLGGKRWRNKHPDDTAKLLCEMNPDFIRVRTLAITEDMPLYEKYKSGDFIPLSEDEIVLEEKRLVENLSGIDSNFVSDHILNLLEEVEGKLPEDKDKMLSVIDEYLALPPELKLNFKLGRRAGLYRSTKELEDDEKRERVFKAIEKLNISEKDEKKAEEVFFAIRKNYI